MTDDPWFDPAAIPKLERMVGPTVAREIIDLYFREAPKRLDAIRSGGRSGELELAAQALHSLKSSAGMLGALGLQRLAETMEQQAWADDGAALVERLDELEAAMNRLDPLLRAEWERIGA